MSDISDTSIWLKFFTEAGIPPSDATGYAITFTDNRIKQDMLMDLNKEYLKDMGINVLGDIIAILKHARCASEVLLRQKAFPKPRSRQSSPSINSSQEAPANSTIKKNAAATRMLEHYVRKEPPTALPAPSSSTPGYPLGSSPRLSTSTKRPYDDDETMRPSKRSSVFNRLGSENLVSSTTDSPKITVTILGKKKLKDHSETAEEPLPISPAKLNVSERPIATKGGLQYHGILKYSQKEIDQRRLSLHKKLTQSPNLSITLKSDTRDSPSTIKSRLGRSTRSPFQSEGIFARELESLPPKKSSTLVSDSIPQFRKLSSPTNAEIRRLSSPNTSRSSGDIAVGKGHTLISDSIPQIRKLTSSTSRNSGGLVIKKIVRVNKKTGQIISEKQREVKSSVFSRIQN